MDLTRNHYQLNSTWNAPYTFSGKEKDAETGYGYFGTRYYDSGLSIWLSVDPMSDKYPSMSPYNYCANNPVILVDPDGREVFLLGELANVAYNQLVNRAKNLNFSFDEKTGKISADVKEGAKLSKTEKHLLKAINDKNSIVKIQTVKADQGETTFEIDGGMESYGGSFMGTTLIETESDVKASSTNMVEPNLLANLDTKECGTVGTNLIHEINEGFEACSCQLKKIDQYQYQYMIGVGMKNLTIGLLLNHGVLICKFKIEKKWKKLLIAFLLKLSKSKVHEN